MITSVLQNGISVSEVKPGTPVQLSSGGTGLFVGNVRYVVMDGQGSIVLEKSVAVNFYHNSWYDWIAPKTPGLYYFWGNYDGDKEDYVQFNVTADAITPIPGGGGYIPPVATPPNPTPTPSPATPPKDGKSNTPSTAKPATDPGFGKSWVWDATQGKWVAQFDLNDLAIPLGIGALGLILLLVTGKKRH